MNITTLSGAVRAQLAANRQTLDGASAEIGVARATLTKWTRGDVGGFRLSDAEKVGRWMGVPPIRLLRLGIEERDQERDQDAGVTAVKPDASARLAG